MVVLDWLMDNWLIIVCWALSVMLIAGMSYGLGYRDAQRDERRTARTALIRARAGAHPDQYETSLRSDT
jgi:hypothetical protein